MIYEIEERKGSPEDTRIKKTGDFVVFSLGEIIASETQLEKIRKELQGQVDFEAAKMSNVEQHHPFVLKMSEQDLFTAHMYQGSKAIVLVGREKIAQIDKALEESQKEREEIKRQIPDIDVPAPTALEAPVAPEVASPEVGVPTSPEFMPGAEDASNAESLK